MKKRLLIGFLLAIFALGLASYTTNPFSNVEKRKANEGAKILQQIIDADRDGYFSFFIYEVDNVVVPRLENARSLAEWRTVLRLEEAPDESKNELDNQRQRTEESRFKEELDKFDEADSLAKDMKSVRKASGWQSSYLDKLQEANQMLSQRRAVLRKYTRLTHKYSSQRSEYRYALGVLNWRVNTRFELKSPMEIREFADSKILPAARQVQATASEIEPLTKKIDAYNLQIEEILDSATRVYSKNTRKKDILYITRL